ncbi:hypothetical protein [Caudoviricetes sp.]|nr:hypothetical protein [Caudoviricetes sp.]
MLTNSITQRLEKDADWTVLSTHIKETVNTLDSLDGINFLNKEEAAIEGRARVLAKEKLQAILEPFYGAEESTIDNKSHLGKKTGVLS